LLRALDERVFEPVGSNDSQDVRARFIVASNRMLEREVEAGRFRADLYFRLNVVHFHLPPLRERRCEIRAIARYFIGTLSPEASTQVRIEPEALHALEQYAWPGNIRELRNVIERCMALRVSDVITWDDLPDAIRLGPRAASGTPQPAASFASALQPAAAPPWTPRPPSPSTVWSRQSTESLSALASARLQAEVERICEALVKHQNNRKRAADELGISRTALYKKLRKYGMMDTH
jgi:DNA-binding NtrC family response regulator